MEDDVSSIFSDDSDSICTRNVHNSHVDLFENTGDPKNSKRSIDYTPETQLKPMVDPLRAFHRRSSASIRSTESVLPHLQKKSKGLIKSDFEHQRSEITFEPSHSCSQMPVGHSIRDADCSENLVEPSRVTSPGKSLPTSPSSSRSTEVKTNFTSNLTLNVPVFSDISTLRSPVRDWGIGALSMCDTSNDVELKTMRRKNPFTVTTKTFPVKCIPYDVSDNLSGDKSSHVTTVLDDDPDGIQTLVSCGTQSVDTQTSLLEAHKNPCPIEHHLHLTHLNSLHPSIVSYMYSVFRSIDNLLSRLEDSLRSDLVHRFDQLSRLKLIISSVNFSPMRERCESSQLPTNASKETTELPIDHPHVYRFKASHGKYPAPRIGCINNIVPLRIASIRNSTSNVGGELVDLTSHFREDRSQIKIHDKYSIRDSEPAMVPRVSDSTFCTALCPKVSKQCVTGSQSLLTDRRDASSTSDRSRDNTAASWKPNKLAIVSAIEVLHPDHRDIKAKESILSILRVKYGSLSKNQKSLRLLLLLKDNPQVSNGYIYRALYSYDDVVRCFRRLHSVKTSPALIDGSADVRDALIFDERECRFIKRKKRLLTNDVDAILI